MTGTVTHKLIEPHLCRGPLRIGCEIELRIDQTLTQDATGTLVMLELEAIGLGSVKTELSVQYVDHNILQTDFKNPDDHVFLENACKQFGIWYSRPGNGISHKVHMESFGVPGKSLLGSDSHTPAAGGLGMIAVGAGGIEVAMAMAGKPFSLCMPGVLGVELQGRLPDWVSAKDVILEMLRRHGVAGARGKIIEYYGEGIRSLSVMDRHVIANMGAELGATSTVFPSDVLTRDYLQSQGREGDWIELSAESDAKYDFYDSIDLSRLEPLIALPSSPGNVVPVRDVEGLPIYQAYVGSSANPGYRDFAIAAEIVANHQVPSLVSFDINPSSRQTLDDLVAGGALQKLIRAGARIHQAGCNGCIGMGQAPATGQKSLRTVPRNFPGRSGTQEDQVYLVSPETAAASARFGVITDPRNLDMEYPKITRPVPTFLNRELLMSPPANPHAKLPLPKGPNITALPEFEELPDELTLEYILRVGDNISTDEISPAGTRSLPYRSNLAKLSERCFIPIDETYVRRAKDVSGPVGHLIVAGDNYGQGSSREHAALAPRYLGLRVVIAKSFARIHQENLINHGVLPLLPVEPEKLSCLPKNSTYALKNIHEGITTGEFTLQGKVEKAKIKLRLTVSEREAEILRSGGLLNLAREQLREPT